MSNLSIKTRIVFWFLALATLLLVVFSLSFYLNARRTSYRALDEMLASRARAFASMVEFDRGQLEFETDGAFVFDPQRGDLGREFAVYRASDRTEIFLSPGLEDHPALTASLTRFLPRGAISSSPTTTTLPWDRRVLRIHAGAYSARTDVEDSTGIAPGDPRLEILIVTVEDLALVHADLRRILWMLLASCPITLMIAALFGWLLARRIIAPVSLMAEAAANIQASELAGRVPVRGCGDELDRLAITLNQAFDRLASALKNQSRFTADAAHEVRTPVAVIRAQAESILRTKRSPEEYLQAFERVLESVLRMEDLVGSLLILSRADSSDGLQALEQIDLSSMTRRLAAERTQNATKRSLALDCPTGDSVIVRCDRHLVEMALRNLLDNAIRFSTEAGTITIEVHTEGTSAVFEISDQGVGIPPKHLPHIFDRFYTTNTSRSRIQAGTGLGLSLVQAIARLHGGSVSARSTLGKGSVFRLRLPLDSQFATTSQDRRIAPSVDRIK